MILSNAGSLVLFVLAGVVYLVAPEDSIPQLSQPLTWVFVTLVLGGAIAGNLRAVALSTTVTLLVPDDRHDKANGLVGTANGVAFALTSVFSGLAIGQLGMGPCLIITIALTAIVGAHLATIQIEGDAAPHEHDEDSPASASTFDLRGALNAVRAVPGLLALLFFSTFNNFLGGVFMALMDPYGLELMSVEAWGILLAISSFGFIVGGAIVARRGLGTNPVRTLLLVNVVMWSITILFPIRSLVLPLAIGFFLYMVVIPMAEASEQTVIQRVVPYREQGRVFGFAQTVETAASPVTAFLIGPIAQAWVIPFMSDGAGAETIGGWFGTGPDRGMALIFIIAGSIGLLISILALNSQPYKNISRSYAARKSEPALAEESTTGP
jgi:DHA3 family multidrug efflux protein-like MFS transporter